MQYSEVAAVVSGHLAGGTSVVIMADRTSLPASDVDHRGIHHRRLGVGAAIQKRVRTRRNGRRSTLTSNRARISAHLALAGFREAERGSEPRPEFGLTDS